jgi:hypothetical protein
MQLYVLSAKRQLPTCLIIVNLKYCVLFTEYSLLSGSIKVLYPFFFSEEDKYGTYAKLLIKYFLAEGILSGHSLVVASQDYDCETLVCYV